MQLSVANNNDTDTIYVERLDDGDFRLILATDDGEAHGFFSRESAEILHGLLEYLLSDEDDFEDIEIDDDQY